MKAPIPGNPVRDTAKKGISKVSNVTKPSKEFRYFLRGDFAKYSDKWIALKDKGVISSKSDIGDLMALIRKKKIDNVVYARVPSRKR